MHISNALAAYAASVCLAVAGGTTTLVLLLCTGCQREPALHALGRSVAEGQLAECRLPFLWNPEEAYAEICLKDQSLIKDLVLNPIAKAKRARDPGRSCGMANLTFFASDGSRPNVMMDKPWGYFGINDDYFVTDFSKFRAACQKALRQAQLFIGPEEKKDQRRDVSGVGDKKRNLPIDGTAVAECRVAFLANPREPCVEICLEDGKLIKDLVLSPIAEAKRDSKSVKSDAMATLWFIAPDGSRRSVVLYEQWGRYSSGDDYFITDFHKLRVACRKAVQHAQMLTGPEEKEEQSGDASGLGEKK